jgi:hypothetical protein
VSIVLGSGPVVSRLKTRLSGWNNRFLLFGGHFILLISVLTFLHVYVILFFRTPYDIISSFESLLNKFSGYLSSKVARRVGGSIDAEV